MASKSAVTQAQLAKATGVSQATISRCLRGDPAQSATSCARIRKIAQELGYVPNPFASGMARERREKNPTPSSSLAIIAGNPHYDPLKIEPEIQQLVSAARDQANALGYSIEYFWRYNPELAGPRMAKVIKTRNILGLFLFHLSHEELNVPWDQFSIVLQNPTDHSPLFHHLTSNRFQNTQIALEECQRLGYRRPALLINLADDLNRKGEIMNLGAYMAYSHLLGDAKRIPPFDRNQSAKEFGLWFKKYQPDVLLGSGPAPLPVPCGFKIPQEVGYVSLSGGKSLVRTGATYVGDRMDVMGSTAIDLLTTQIHRHERGFPTHPRCVVIAGQWHEGSTTLRQRSTSPIQKS